MARPPAPAHGQQASTAVEGERETAAAMLPNAAADKEDTFGTKTLSQLREEAIQQRKNALEAIMPERAALLRELFFLLTDKQDPARFGAGLDPTGLSLDPAQEAALQEKIAAFTERWIREPRVASQIPTELPPLKPTPPPSPMRRDSTMLDMSEEVAAVERELIKPEYRKQPPPPLSTTGAARNIFNSGGAGNDMNVDGDSGSASPLREGASSHRRQHSLVSPFPITFHSPGFSASTPPIKQEDAPFPLVLQTISTQEPPSASGSGSASLPDTAAMNAQAGPSRLSSPRKSHAALDASPLRAYPVPYTPSLPPLPDYMVKNRVNVGGLNRKKTRDRFAIQQNPQLAGTLATSADLYKLGVSRALHSSVRSLVGAGALPPEKSRTGGKVLSTSDWQVVISEMQSQRAMERIEQLKAERTWSLRQYRKQRPPATHKAHWDYLLDEMRWMAVDFKQETRWKIATAYELARAVEDYHNAESEEERHLLQIAVREPNYLTEGVAKGVDGDDDTQMDSVVPESQDDGDTSLTQAVNEKGAASAEKAATSGDPVKKGKAAADGTAPTPSTAGVMALPTPIGAPEVRHKKYQHQLLKARAPIFDLSLNATVFDVSKADLPEAYSEATTYDLTNELFQELAAYGPPAEPSTDSRQNRRIDESNPNYARISNPAYMLESKPLLVSTLHPSKKRKSSGEWGDLTDLLAEDGKDPLSEIYGAGAETAPPPPNAKVKDTGNKRFTPSAPPNADQRLALLEWTPEEDRLLFNFARLYGYNWDLIASIFNSATHRLKGDERLPWDCYDRWHKKYAPIPTPASAGLSSSGTPAQPSAPLPAGAVASGQQSPGQMQQQQTDAQANLKKDKRATSATLAAPVPPSVPIVKKPELSKAQIRHMSIMDATKKAQKKREMQQRNNMQPAVRKINLNAHESHNQPMHPGLTALDLSRLKAERERQHMEEMRKREQAKMYQQAQAAAMAQTQAQQQGGGQQRGAMPPNMQGPPMQGPQMPQLPPGAMPPNLQGSQPLPIMQGQPSQQQRIPMGQMPPGMQMQGPMPQQHQQGQPRPMPQQGGQQIPRPPSQAGQQQQGPVQGQQAMPMQQQQVMMNGQAPMMVAIPATSPPMQPNMHPMHVPIQPMPQQMNGSPSAHSQSPQPSQMQKLSPHQVQMQLQQHQAGNQQMSPAQQQALLAQLSQMRAGSPSMAPGQLPGGFPIQMSQHMTPEQQQQQLMALMRMRQNSQASSQGSVQ